MEPRLKRKLDYSDYAAIPSDGKRYEVVQGKLYVTPSPNTLHQRISKRLGLLLVNYFEARSIGEVFFAPIDLILTQQDVLQPDLLVVSDPLQISDRGIEGAPLLIVEILSPSTRKLDLGAKTQRYADLGVQHYWLVDPEQKRMECCRLDGNVYRRLIEARGDAQLKHPEWDGLVIDLAALWR